MYRQIKITIWFLLSLAFNGADGYRILGIFPHTGKSHHIMLEPILRGLAEKGHNLTVISHYPMTDAPATYKDISLVGTRHLNLHICDFDDFLFLSGPGRLLRDAMATYELFDLANLNCKAMAGHRGVRELVASNETFDVILTEQFNSDCALGIVNKLKVPVIGIATHVPMPWTRRRFGMPEHPAHVPNHFLKHCRHPSFLETAESLMVNAYYNLAYYVHTHYFEYRFLKDFYLESRQDLDKAAEYFNMLMVTTYFPVHSSVPNGPNVVEIGGVHLSGKLRKLDEDVQKFLDDSENGVIYFSMGSMIRGKSLPLETLKMFQNAFAKLPYRVLWKWENDTMPGITSNIMIKQWTPQNEILNHKNVKVFICHGGLLGLTEAVQHGVPVLVIPFFGDQFVNGKAAEESGIGRVLEYHDITEERIIKMLEELTSSELIKSARKLSAIWKNRPQSPLETAIFWVEHIAQFGGSHLKPASIDLPWIRHLLLDVIVFLAVVLSIYIYLCVKITRFFVKRIYYSCVGKKPKIE